MHEYRVPIESNLIKDSECLLQILRGFLLCFSLDHELHELSEVNGT